MSAAASLSKNCCMSILSRAVHAPQRIHPRRTLAMTDDEGLHVRWEELPHDVRAVLESMGITEALINYRWDDPSRDDQTYKEALRRLIAHNRAAEAEMPPKVRRAYRKAVMREMRRDIENDVFLTDLERDLHREEGNR
jgi:hypothetical protein